jgi:hypothetical protein
MSHLPLVKFGLLLTDNFWANRKSFAWQHGGTHCRLIKLPHVTLAPCNSCLLVMMENELPVHFLLVDELPKLQSYLELCRFSQVSLQPGLQDGKCHFHWNWPENLIMILIPTDSILLELRNQKGRYRAWSLVATTSQLRTLSMLLLQDSTGTSITLLVWTPVIRPSNVGVSSAPNPVNPLLFAYHRAMSLWFHKMCRVSIPSSKSSRWMSYLIIHRSSFI